MASLLIHSIPSQWSNPIQDLVNIFQQHEEGRHLWLLLDLLTVIPEEFSTQVSFKLRNSPPQVKGISEVIHLLISKFAKSMRHCVKISCTSCFAVGS